MNIQPSKGDMIDLVNGLCPRGTSAYWLASFKTSPPEYLSECMRLLREGEIPYIDMELRNSLINFYSELADAYNL